MTSDENNGPWPERLSTLREIMWMVLAVILGLLIIPAAIAVPFAWLFNSEAVFIWLLIGGSVLGGFVGYRFYQHMLRTRAVKTGRMIELRGAS